MGLKGKRVSHGVDLLSLSEAERRWLIVRARMILQRKAVEAKLGQSFPDLAVCSDQGSVSEAKAVKYGSDVAVSGSAIRAALLKDAH